MKNIKLLFITVLLILLQAGTAFAGLGGPNGFTDGGGGPNGLNK